MSDVKSIALPASPGARPLAAQIRRGYEAARDLLRQPAIQRAAPIMLVALTMAAGVAAVFFLREPSMTQIFARIGEEDKAQVLQTLDAQGVRAKLDANTGAILVPRADYHRARMQLAAAGLPKAAVNGYDLLNQLPLGASRAVESVKLKQAQENELARSIMEIRDVDGARVHLAIPERSAFLREQSPPTASVVLKLAPGRSLSQGQVQSIAHLVSSSTPYLPVGNVTVVDQSGALLTSPQRDGDIGLSSQQLEYRARVERMLRDRVASLLTPLLGAGNFNSEVNADIDFTRTEQTSEIYDPAGQAVRSQQESTQESNEARARGVPGATSNSPPNVAQLAATPPAAPQPNADGPRSRSNSTVRNYEVSRELRSTRRASGDIKRVTLAVVVRAGSTPDENGKMVEKPMSEAERARLTALLQEAIGYLPERGDKIALHSAAFAEEQKFDARSWYDAPWLEDAIKQIVVLLILGVIVLGALKPFLERMLERPSHAPPPTTDGAGELDSIEVRDGETLDDIKARLKPKKSAISPELLDTANTYDDKVTLIRMLVGDDAARVTAVLKSLIQRDLD